MEDTNVTGTIHWYKAWKLLNKVPGTYQGFNHC